MNSSAATKNDPARHNQSRCGNNYNAASALNQSKKIINVSQAGANMNKVAVISDVHEVTSTHFDAKQIEILKNSICKGVSDEEFQVFLMACKKTQLDPFMRQIYAVKRWDSRLKKEVMSIQTGIDGYRLIAERTGRYAPGRKPTFDYDSQGNLLAATAYVKKMTNDGTWHEVEAEAYLDEYCQTSLDKTTGERKAMGMWSNMQRNQLAKCAESLALRKAFPSEMSGVYTKDEMKQADPITISLEQVAELEYILGDCDPKYRDSVYDYVEKLYKTRNLAELPLEIYPRIKEAAAKNMEYYCSKQRQLAEQIQHELVSTEVQ